MPVSMSVIQIKDQMNDPYWRLNNIYWCVTEDGKQVKFRMRPAQMQFWDDMYWRNIIIKARQLGFTTEVCIMGLDFALFNPNKTVGFIAHKSAAATNIYKKKILFPLDCLPDEVRKSRFDSKLNQRQDAGGYINFLNGSSINVGLSFRSDTCQFLHVSEFGKICARYPSRAEEIITGSLPTVHRNGRIIFESTTEGAYGYLYDMATEARNKLLSKTQLTYLDYKLHFFPWFDDPKYEYTPKEAKHVVITDERHEYFDALEKLAGIKLGLGRRAWHVATKATLGDKMLNEHPSTFEEAFQTVIEGAYYKKQLDKAREEGRIGDYPLIPGVPVHTFWDLGVGDEQAIWGIQIVGGMFRVVWYYTNSGEGLPHYIQVLKDTGFTFGDHWGPHDIAVREWSSGQARIETARKMGIRFFTAPNLPHIEDGIDASRRFFKHCLFHEAGCKDGIAALTAYQKKRNAKGDGWMNKPLHNWASNGADAFRYAAVSIGDQADKQDAPSEKQEFSTEKSLEDMASIWKAAAV